jgi:hypothetical protein
MILKMGKILIETEANVNTETVLIEWFVLLENLFTFFNY